MKAIASGQRICTFFDGLARHGRVVRIEPGVVVCTFEDDLHEQKIEYAMAAGEVYAVAEDRQLNREFLERKLAEYEAVKAEELA